MYIYIGVYTSFRIKNVKQRINRIISTNLWSLIKFYIYLLFSFTLYNHMMYVLYVYYRFMLYMCVIYVYMYVIYGWFLWSFWGVFGVYVYVICICIRTYVCSISMPSRSLYVNEPLFLLETTLSILSYFQYFKFYFLNLVFYLILYFLQYLSFPQSYNQNYQW